MPHVPLSVRLCAVALPLVLTSRTALAQGPRDPASAPVTVVNTAANPVQVTGAVGLTGPVPVLQSGSWTVTTQDMFAPGRAPKRFGPITVGHSSSLVGEELVPPVTAGQTFILTHVYAVHFAGNSALSLVHGACTLHLREGSLYTPFVLLPMVAAGRTLALSEQTSLPVMAAEGLYVSCGGVMADGTAPPQSGRVTASGYFVPAIP